MVAASGIRDLLDERPELESAVEAALEADEPFAFDDLDVDSGRFGELVDADVLERTDDGYVVAERGAVRRALAGEVDEQREGRSLDVSVSTPDASVLAALAAATAFVVVLRLAPLPAVFRDGAVVLSGNDAYYYRYWIEQILLEPRGSLATLPDSLRSQEPLMVGTLWLVAELFGGTRPAAGRVLAWYPVVSAALTSILLYLLTVETTDDRRIGIAAVVMLAVVPGHAARTSVGFADHHAFDVPWLVLTALALVVLVGADLRTRRAVAGAVGLGVGIAGQTLAWWAGPLLVLPVGLIVLAQAALARRNDESPARAMVPTLAGLALGAVLVLLAHVGFGWHTTAVALTPVLLLVGSAAAVAIVAGGRRYDLDGRYVLAGVIGAGVVGAAVVATVLPGLRTQAVEAITGQLFRTADIGETQGLFTGAVDWLFWFGFVLALAIPYLAWGTSKLFDDARWTVPVAYGWYLIVLAAVQVRFIALLAPFTAVFAGLGFVHIAERVDLARRPAPFGGAGPIDGLTLPEGTKLGSLALLLLLVTGLGIVQVPIQTYETTTPAEQYRTADWMADYSEDRGWTYPDNYVFSRWGDSRMYNYFVNGESQSYGFAMRLYAEFVGGSEPERFYERLRDRTGFVVYSGSRGRTGTVGRALDAYGSRTDGTDGLQHYRAVHVSDSGRYKAFVLVEGATITGAAESDAAVTLRSDRRLDGRSFVYERRVRPDANGRYRVTVPYPGEYTVDGTTVRVPEQAVASGGNVSTSG